MKSQLLDELAELYAQRDLLAVDRMELESKAIPIEVKAALADIADEFGPKQAALAEKIEATEQEIKAKAKEAGETLDGNLLQAVFTGGRVTWDTKYLDRYAEEHPDLLTFRRQGDPSVAIRRKQVK